jgi:hypothetical protein
MAEDEPQIATSAFTQVTSNVELEEIYLTYHACRGLDTSSKYSMATSTYPLFSNMTFLNNAAITKEDKIALAAARLDPYAADTGATVSISPFKADFYTFEIIAPIKIYGVGGTFIEATAKGKVHIRQDNSTIFIIVDIYFVPEASIHLMSIGCVTDCNYTAVFTHKEMFIVNLAETTVDSVVLTAHCCNKKLYFLDGTIVHPNNTPIPVQAASALAGASDAA